MQADKRPDKFSDRSLIIASFAIAGVVGGLYAVVILDAATKLKTAVISRKMGQKMEDFLKGLG